VRAENAPRRGSRSLTAFEEVGGRIDDLELEVERKRALLNTMASLVASTMMPENDKNVGPTFSKPNVKFKATAIDDVSSDGALLWCALFQGNIAER
jgi:hypothetical protein